MEKKLVTRDNILNREEVGYIYQVDNSVLEVFAEDIKDKQSMIYRHWNREKRRKERGNHEHENMLKRYDEECGECIVIKPAKGV